MARHHAIDEVKEAAHDQQPASQPKFAFGKGQPGRTRDERPHEGEQIGVDRSPE